MIRLRRIRELRSQQIDHRRYLIVIPGHRELLHNSFNLYIHNTYMYI